MSLFNTTCPSDNTEEEDPSSFFEAGTINFDAHRVGWAFSGICALIATCISFFLIWKHCQYYTKPNQQRYIIRILLMVPIYAIISWLSYRFFRDAIYYETIRDCYEAFVIASFFILLLQYIGDTTESQTSRLHTKPVRKFIFPLNFWTFDPSSQHFLMMLKWGILQYVIVGPVMTVLAVVMQSEGVYCDQSMSPVFGHLYVLFFDFISVTIAMYCLVLFYVVMHEELLPFDPFYKFLCVKLVIFFSFWQTFVLAILVHFDVIKDTQYWTSTNVSSGVASILTCLEMVIFAFLHMRAFSYRVYRPEDRKKTSVLAAMVDSLNPIDTLREIGYGIMYLYRLFTGQPLGPGNRLLDLEMALGKRRPPPTTAPPTYMMRSDSLAHFQRLQEEGSARTADPDELMMENLRGPSASNVGANGKPGPMPPQREGSAGGAYEYPRPPQPKLPRRQNTEPIPAMSSLSTPSHERNNTSSSSAYTTYQYRPAPQPPALATQTPHIVTNTAQRNHPTGVIESPQSAPVMSTRVSNWDLDRSHASMPPEQVMQLGGYDFDGTRTPPRRGGHGAQQASHGQQYNYHVYD